MRLLSHRLLDCLLGHIDLAFDTSVIRPLAPTAQPALEAMEADSGERQKAPKIARFSRLFKRLARDPKIPSCIY
jgi:hypothetical protein